jgi:LPXTG-motif cell wall-anchored protein
MSTNKLEILTPYIALAGLVIAVSAVVVVKRRRD